MSVTDIKPSAAGNGGLLAQIAGSGTRSAGQPFEQVLGQQMAVTGATPAQENAPAAATRGVITDCP